MTLTRSKRKIAEPPAPEVPGADTVVVPPGAEAKPQAADLLCWYDRHRRDLPWRARPGETPDPYRVWLSEIMLQQTTVTAVRPYFAAFLQRFPTVEALAAAPSEAVMSAWAGLGYYSRARNLHACAQAVVGQHGGSFPDTEEGLRKLPGIGAYTAGAIAAIAFDRPAAAVDGNVERVVSRLFRVDEPMPAAKASIRALTQDLVPVDRPGDFAQALMDLGATICTPKRPACALCPWMRPCRARQAGLQESYPVKAPKREGVLRRGAAFVAVRPDGAILLRTRPPKGLLGGMAEVPTSEWRSDYDPAKAILDAPFEARWRRAAGVVRHVFTHFPLELSVFVGRAAAAAAAPEGMRWAGRDELAAEPLPNVMKKVLALAFGGEQAVKPKPVSRAVKRRG
ncbi:A/G-specific adenine glycosylase [Enterovirga sp. CN4-39]|uniref:A/G-specific adenine glycosylase n=1 Tax=Enterovirga sp. CN4-39 TaxID=3400910 RepID=UPI003C0F2C55